MHKKLALTPPMGWNSWDCYGAAVNEEQLLANADYMAKNLKDYGWEYVVCDIQWSEPTADSFYYNYFAPLCMDEYSRLIPSVERFPSSANGKGFKPIADYIHSLGLKFGIHIMRGIPRQAAHQNTKIKCEGVTAKDIAKPSSICLWNPDMYGLETHKKGAQEYYDSIFELYAEWGVDFVKIDDICNTNMYPANPYSAEKEIEMISAAIEDCGRPIVLSLSPGPAVIEKAHHLKAHANMWRITDDFWDDWKLLKGMFERCEVWQEHVGNGNWPDCDMLPLNVLGYGWGKMDDKNNKGWKSKFTQEEARTMITLWSIFRSPLMIGTDLPQLDDFSLSLLTNEEIIAMNKNPNRAYQVSNSCNDDLVFWVNEVGDVDETHSYYECIFNTSEEPKTVRMNTSDTGLIIRDLWERKDLGTSIEIEIAPHACKALLIK